MGIFGGTRGGSPGLRPIDVAAPQARGHGACHRVATRADGRSVWFESRDLPLAASSEAFGAALLVPALHAGRPLRLEGGVCETWAANLARLTDEFRKLWYATAPRPLAVPTRSVAAGIVPAESAHQAPHTPREGCPRPRSAPGPTALCFSGGLEAFHTLLAGGHHIDTLVFVVGYDLSHRDRRRAAVMTKLLDDVAAETGCRKAIITTNLRRHPLLKRTPWLRAFAGPLAAVGHLLGPAAGRMLISSDGLGFEHPEVGARPSTDPLHGSATLAVEHVGHPIPRLEKIVAIAGEPVVQRHLRVCWQDSRESRGRLNCGHCEKCLRTMLAIDACGLLGQFPGFDHGRGLVAAIDALPEVNGVVEPFYRDLLARGLSASAAAAVQRLLVRSTTPCPRVAAGSLPAESAHHRQTHSAGRMPAATLGMPATTLDPCPRVAAGSLPAESAHHRQTHPAGRMPATTLGIPATTLDPCPRVAAGILPAESAHHRLLSPAAFTHVFEPLVGRRVGYLRPEGNVGDHLIEVAMIQLLAEYGIRWRLVRPDCPADTDGLDLLAFGGGGNMGTRYTGNHALRTQALATGLPVVILPQSFTSPEDRSFAKVFVRERGSLALRPDGVLAPDLALGLATPEPPRPTRDLGVFLRRDQERGGRKPFFVRDPVRLFRDPFAYLAFAARHRRIVTDRLHFAVAGLHAGREVTLVANDYHKNRSMHETWLADLGCHFATTSAEALGRRAA